MKRPVINHLQNRCHAHGFKWHVIKLVRVTYEERYLKYIPKYGTKLWHSSLYESMSIYYLRKKKDNYTL